MILVCSVSLGVSGQTFRVVLICRWSSELVLLFQEAEEIPGLLRLPVFRLDEGEGQFHRRWGYETLEIIKENAEQHDSEGKLIA